jgi:hypothetical protein
VIVPTSRTLRTRSDFHCIYSDPSGVIIPARLLTDPSCNCPTRPARRRPQRISRTGGRASSSSSCRPPTTSSRPAKPRDEGRSDASSAAGRDSRAVEVSAVRMIACVPLRGVLARQRAAWTESGSARRCAVPWTTRGSVGTCLSRQRLAPVMVVVCGDSAQRVLRRLPSLAWRTDPRSSVDGPCDTDRLGGLGQGC